VSDSTIIVALDGSKLSEHALPYATAMAKATGAKLLLATVWEEGERALIANLSEAAEGLFKEGEEYWEHYAASLAENAQAEGVEAEAEVLIGDAPAEILHLVETREANLLVIGTHGRSGLNRWRYGSVASRLIREAPIPTLVIGPGVLESVPQEAAIRRILVPLDGSPLAETALRPALELADKLGAELVLAQALQWTTQAFIYGIPDANIAQVDEDLTKAAESYLAKVKDWLKAERKVETAVLHGPVADALISLVSKQEIDLVVMTSHTRAGVARAFLGSIADRLLQGDAPVLLIRPEEPTALTRPPQGRFCHACGRASRHIELMAEDVCTRCGQHLRACANCVYYDGIACMIKRPELHDTYPGRDCAYFQFRESQSPADAMAERRWDGGKTK
jgi:nucleotide-binding universal stress UspA family protein